MQDWQKALSNAVENTDELLRTLELNSAHLDPATQAAIAQFPLRVPRGFVARMEKGNPNDPLLLQVLPTKQEMDHYPGYTHDPLAEKNANPVPGLLHKYHGRVLLTLAGGCAINCRYCFRRHFPYEENMPSTDGWQKTLAYIANDSSIEEVIFSGGDPLIMKDTQLAKLVSQLEKIQHVKRLRIHTRLPIVIPERINSELISWIDATRFKTIVVLHCNHPNEIDDTVIAAIKKLQTIHVTLLNQSVLLKDVNDNANVLIALSNKLFDNSVLPYYLHLLDRVQGSAHFDVDEKNAKQIIQRMINHLPGYLVPKLVREIAGADAKVPV